MGFDIFTQPRGPNIDISLFPNAASKGVAAGQALGSPISNAVEGAIKGYQQGQQVYSESQNQQIRQNQIDSFPLDQKVREQQYELNRIKIENSAVNSQLELQAETAKLQNELSKNQSELSLRKRTSEFYEQFKNASPAEQQSMILDGSYADVLASNKDLDRYAVGRVAATTTDPVLKEKLNTYLTKSRISQAGEAEARKRQGAYSDAKSVYENSDLTKVLSSQLTELTPEEYADNVVFEPSDKFETDAQGNVVFDYTTGQPRLSKNWDSSKKSPYVDVYSKDYTRKLASYRDPKEELEYKNYIKEANYQSGKYTQNALKQVDNKAAKAEQKPVDVFQATPSAPKSPVEDVSQKVVSKFSLPESSAAKIEPTVKSIAGSISSYVKDPTNRAVHQYEIEQQKSVLARSISDEQFDISPALQAQVTEEEVNRYNDALRAQAANKGIDMSLLLPFKMNSRKDLYYEKNKVGYLSAVTSYVDSLYSAQIRDYGKPLNSARSKQSVQDYLRQRANGRSGK